MKPYRKPRIGARAKRQLRVRALRTAADSRFYADIGPGVGVYEPQPYNGPREFFVGPLTDVMRRGRVPSMFRVIRDESLHLPYGGFRIYYGDQEVGRTIGWPTYEDCRVVRRSFRRNHG